jgi:hypothetical protein
LRDDIAANNFASELVLINDDATMKIDRQARMTKSCAVFFLALAPQCGFASPAHKEDDYSERAYECSQKVGALLRNHLSNTPRFTTVHARHDETARETSPEGDSSALR